MESGDIKVILLWAMAFAVAIWLGIQISTGVGDFLGHVL